MKTITTKDKKTFNDTEFRLLGCVPTIRSRKIDRELKIGQYPVMIDLSDRDRRIFTYSSKIIKIEDDEANVDV